MVIPMIVAEEIDSKQLADLIKRVQAGDEVLITQDKQPVARLVRVDGKGVAPGIPLQFHSLKGHQVLTPVITQEELADELFSRQ